MDMFCPNCNKLFPSDHHYCYICGAALLEHTDTNNMSDNESELETDNNIWEPWDTEDDVYSEVSDSSDSVASVDDDVEVIEDFDDDEVIEDSDDDYDNFDYDNYSWEPIGNIWENDDPIWENDDAIWGTVDSISDTSDDEAEKENYDPIYMKELETYDIDCVEITKSDITKRYIQVHINNMFKFCPDFTPDLDTKGKCFLHDDYVIMAFCRSGQLGIYKIKVNGKKVSLLFSIDYNKDDDIFSFYEVIDGRYILCCASKVLFFNPDDKDASFEVFDMDIRISGINALYSGNRMLLTPYERNSRFNMSSKNFDYYDDYNEYNNYTAVIWFDGHQTIDVLKTEWFKKCSEICDNYVYNYCVNNSPEYLSIDSKTNEIYISGYKNKFCIIPSEGLRFSCSCSYDYFISIISARCDLKYDSNKQFIFSTNPNGQVFIDNNEITLQEKDKLDNDITGYEEYADVMFNVLKYYYQRHKYSLENYAILKCNKKDNSLLDLLVTLNNYRYLIKYDLEKDSIYCSMLKSENIKFTINNVHNRAKNESLERVDIISKVKDRIGWFLESMDNFEKYELVCPVGIITDNKVFFTYPPIQNGTLIPDSEICGALLLYRTNIPRILALRIMFNEQTVHYYWLSDEDVDILDNDAILLKDWFLKRKNDFKFAFKKCSDFIYTDPNMHIPTNIANAGNSLAASGSWVFGIDEDKKNLKAAGIDLYIYHNILHNGENIKTAKIHTEEQRYKQERYTDSTSVFDWPECTLRYTASFFDTVNREYKIADCTGFALCPKGALIVEDKTIYLMTDLMAPKIKYLELNDKISSLICTDRYLFVTTYKKGWISEDPYYYTPGQSDYWNEGVPMVIVTYKMPVTPTTHVFDFASKYKFGSIENLGTITEIRMDANKDYHIVCLDESNNKTNPYKVRSSQFNILSDLQSMLDNSI